MAVRVCDVRSDRVSANLNCFVKRDAIWSKFDSLGSPKMNGAKITTLPFGI